MKIWVLTRELNEYNQYGEYFVFSSIVRPTKQMLRLFNVPEERIEHVLDGGGRVGTDGIWYNLREFDVSEESPFTADIGGGFF